MDDALGGAKVAIAYLSIMPSQPATSYWLRIRIETYGRSFEFVNESCPDLWSVMTHRHPNAEVPHLCSLARE